MGFEPTRGDPIGLAGRRLNRSAKVSSASQKIKDALNFRALVACDLQCCLLILGPELQAQGPLAMLGSGKEVAQVRHVAFWQRRRLDIAALSTHVQWYDDPAGLHDCPKVSTSQIRCSIVVSISACHAEDPGSIPGGGVLLCCTTADHAGPWRIRSILAKHVPAQ